MVTKAEKNKTKRWLFWFLGFVFLILLTLFAYLFFLKKTNQSVVQTPVSRDSSGRLIVTTASFPVFEFARIVGGDQAAVSLILPPSVELHSFRPTAETLAEIEQSALFLYTSDILEPWASELKTVNKVTVGVGLESSDNDPHVWLDFSLAAVMVERVKDAYQELDPAFAADYEARAAAYQKELEQLDQEFAAGLSDCRWRDLIVAGHDTFAYLARRYNLNYQALQGFVPDNSVNTELVLTLSDELKASGQPYIFFEELIMPYLGSLMRRGAGVELLALNAAHNVGRFDPISGVTFLSLMRNNLKSLRMGLDCR
ncbi:MAG: metal ABC transporter solute-binding protein, Zn/Mn family [Patescibacteria group bacterium]|jgi:zinc transport system substrate-binding protein